MRGNNVACWELIELLRGVTQGPSVEAFSFIPCFFVFVFLKAISDHI